MRDHYRVSISVPSKFEGVTSTKTTLYHLIGAISDAVKPGEENLILAVVINLIESGKIKKLHSQNYLKNFIKKRLSYENIYKTTLR